MSKQRRTADDFVRDMKARQQQHSIAGDVERKTSEGLAPEQAGAWRGSYSLSGAHFTDADLDDAVRQALQRD